MVSRHEKYFKNYRVKAVPDRSRKGYHREYVYIGDLYSWDLPEKEIRSNRRIFGACEIVTLLLYFGAGIIRSGLNRSRLVAIPSMLALITILFEVFAMWTFCLGKMPYRVDDYSRMNQTFQVTFPARAILLAVAAVAGYVNTFLLHSGAMGILISTGYLLGALTACYLFRKYSRIRKSEKVTESRKH